MSDLQLFRHYSICQDRSGSTVEVWRGADEVACLAFDNKQQVFVELHVAIGPADRQRSAAAFQSLVQLASPLRHRHLLGVLEGGEDEGANYHISEFLDGERLDSWLARCPPLPPWLALLVIQQLTEGLAALSSHPRLLAGVEVFHAGLTLGGPHAGDLCVKVCDLGLSGAVPVSTEPQFVEARAIHETGRLLLYMLTGSLTEGPVTAESLSASQLPPELSFLLTTLFQSGAPHHPRTLEQLRTLTERCALELSSDLAARPDSFPAQFRPRQPLAHHLPEPAATADSVSGDFTLETRSPHAADPYRYRGTERSTRRPANVQVYPPPALLPSEFLLAKVEKAFHELAARRDPRLLAPLAWHPEAPAPVLVEELPGKYTLDTIHRLRPVLQPEEVLLLLTQLDLAATAAESLLLPLHWRSPRLVPLQFQDSEESLPPPAQLARLPLTAWPSFHLKFRTWPVTLDFTQPDRFQLERLLPRDPALTGEPLPHRVPMSPLPSARDLALLTTWLFGGTPQVPESHKSLLYTAISARGPALSGRSEFLDRFRQLTDAAHQPAAPAGSASRRKDKKRSGYTTAVPLPAGRSPGPPEPGLDGGPEPLLDPAEFPFGHEAPAAEGDIPALGFAEALFHGGPAPELSPNGRHPLFGPPSGTRSRAGESAARTDDSPWDQPRPDDFLWLPENDPGAAPIGFMEAAGMTAPLEDPDPGDLPYDEDPESAGRWMLVLVVILIAASVAALMAQLTGQAVWLK